MTLIRAAVAATLLGLFPTGALADIATPRGANAPPAPVERRTGRVPATITVSPVGAGPAPVHLIVTVPREVLQEVMRAPVAGRVGDAGDAVGGATALPPASAFRHIVGAVALALALGLLPLAFRGRRHVVAVSVLLLATAAGVAELAADRAGHPLEEPAADSADASSVGLGQVLGGPPRTIEFVIVPGRGPVRVEARYVR